MPPLGAGFLTGQVENLGDKTMRNLRSRLVLAIAEDWHRVVIATKFRVVASLFASSVFLNLCPHAGQAHTFLKLKKYAKKFCRKLRLPRQCKAEVESYQFLQLPLWAILLH